MKVWITGAARGLGLSLTRLFLEKGDTVYAAVRNPFAPVLAELSECYGDRLRIVEMDLAQLDQIPEAVQQMAAEAPFDVLINNAGVLEGQHQGLQTLSLDEVEQSLRVNLLAPMALTKALYPLMRGAERPAVIHISSEAGAAGTPHSISYSYCISKAGMNMFTNLMLNDGDFKDFLIYAVHPGRMKTDMGGAHRVLLPEETAQGIRGLLTGETQVAPGDWYIDYNGHKMAF